MKKILLFMLGVLIALPGIAKDFTYEYEGQTLTYIVLDDNAKTCEVGGNRTIVGDVIIPAIAKDGDVEYTVTEIRFNSFYGATGLTSVTIPASVTRIGEDAFGGCTGLTSVKCLSQNPPVNYLNGGTNDPFDSNDYKNAVLYLPEGAAIEYFNSFWNNFNDIRIGETKATYSDGTLTYRLVPAAKTGERNIAVVTAGNYSDLTDVTIPDRFTYEAEGVAATRYYVEAIGYGAFRNCTRLSTVTFNSRNKSSLIGDYAFYGCNALTSIDIPASVTHIGEYAFGDATALKTVILHDGLLTIGPRSFQNCTGITSIAIPSSVRTICHHAFFQCSDLNEITLNEGLETIEEFAFWGGGNISRKPITIPTTLKTVGYGAFIDNKFEQVNISDLTAWCNIDFEDYTSNPAYNSGSLYLNGEKIEELVIPESIEAIKKFTFYHNNALKSVTLPTGLKSIGVMSFSGCSGLTSVAIPNSVTEIGSSAFSNCTGLTSIAIPNSVTKIDDNAFFYCTGMTSVQLNEGLQSIGTAAFVEVPIESVSIPGTVTAIETMAFTGTKNATFEYGPDKIQLSGDVFRELNSLSWDRDLNDWNTPLVYDDPPYVNVITIGNNVKEIPASKFKGYRKLAALKLGSGITAIGDEAFSGCTELEAVVLPPHVETIGTSAFAGNTKLATISMGHSVKSIGEKAFDGCVATTIHITAQTPPNAPHSNIFSNYTGTLYVQGSDAVDSYYDAVTCFDRYDAVTMVEATSMDMGDSPTSFDGKPGDTFQLTATLMPEDVTLPHIFWRSTNPDIATVDANGLVTIHADIEQVMAMADAEDNSSRSCKIIAESLYANGPLAEVTVNDVTASGIDDVISDSDDSGEIDFSAPVEVYNLQGMLMGRDMNNLRPGFYIVRQGNKVKKIVVR